MRLFDVPASGNFLITDWRPCMSELFEIDEELIVFHSIEEAVDLVEKYNKDLEARKRIIQAARHRVLSEHTYLHRVESLVRVVIDIWPDIAERPRRRKKTHSHSPDHVSSPLIGALASYLLQGNKEKTAQAFLDEIEKRDGTESLNHMLNAQRAYDQEDYQTAFQECIAAIDAGDHSAHAFFSAGSAALLAEGPRESIPYFLKAAQIDPDSPRNWNCAGRSFLQIEDWAHAKSAIQKALGCNPQYPHAHQCWQAFSDVLLPAQADDDFSDFQLPDAPNS